MAFCPNCGAEVQGRFCAKCGAAVPAGAAPGSMGAGPSVNPSATPSGVPPGAQPHGATTTTNASGLTENVAGALCYVLGLVTGIIFLVLAPYNQSKFVRFHAFQAIFFHVGWVAMWIVYTIIAIAMPLGLHLLLSLFMLLLSFGGLAIWLLLMYKAYNNEKFYLPIVGAIAEKQA
jgi:uncharacterized membrane protein